MPEMAFLDQEEEYVGNARTQTCWVMLSPVGDDMEFQINFHLTKQAMEQLNTDTGAERIDRWVASAFMATIL